MPVKSSKKREGLSRERILRAALDLVDREGLEAVSMRRLGEECGVEAMSLYNHVANKSAIFDGLFEAVLAEVPAGARSASWRSALASRARGLRAALRSHPEVLPIFATRAAVTPASLAQVESVLESLRSGGFSVESALASLHVVLAFVVGHTLASHAPVRSDEAACPDYAALDEWTFPRVREAARVLGARDAEVEFAFGLEALLDGISARLGVDAAGQR